MKILLSQIMYERNISDRQLERMSGVSKSTIHRIANEETSPTLETLVKLAIALHVRISDFFESDYK